MFRLFRVQRHRRFRVVLLLDVQRGGVDGWGCEDAMRGGDLDMEYAVLHVE